MDTLSVLLVTLLFSAVFSGSEMAFLSTNKLMIELNRKKHPSLNKITYRFHRNPGLFISTILIGNNIALVIYGMFMASLLEPYLTRFIDSEFGILFIQTLAGTLLILISAEFLPKIIFRLNPTASLNFMAFPLWIVYTLFRSEERRVGKECRSRWSRFCYKKKVINGDY